MAEKGVQGRVRSDGLLTIEKPSESGPELVSCKYEYSYRYETPFQPPMNAGKRFWRERGRVVGQARPGVSNRKR